ncbi:MAG: nucleotidyltransferase domain-containing protein [Deltaproteobacteria bacterium]|nr:nucleotidyltransferase domain-containing protein [Deltaproteobacteria bacterium]
MKEDARRYADKVRQKFQVERAFLCGSYAKGAAGELSGVDAAFFYAICLADLCLI